MTADALARLLARYPTDPDVQALAGVAPDIAERDRLLREAAERFFPNLKPTTAASRIYSALSAYGSGAWRADCARSEPPAGQRQVMWWQILKASPVLLSVRQIRRILAMRPSNGQRPESRSEPKETTCRSTAKS